MDDCKKKVKYKGANVNLASLGSVWIPSAEFATFESKVLDLRMEHKCFGEIKWGHIDRNHLHIYKKLIDIFGQTESRFNSIISRVPNNDDLHTYFGGSMEVFEKKLAFQLIYQNYKRYRTSYCLEEELSIIGDNPMFKRGVEKDNLLDALKSPTEVPIKCMVSSDSKILAGLQLADLIIGIVLTNFCLGIDSNHNISNEGSDVINYMKSKFDIAVRTSPPLVNAKINNWFHKPR